MPSGDEAEAHLGPGHVSTVTDSACLFHPGTAQNYLHAALPVPGSHKHLTLQNSAPSRWSGQCVGDRAVCGCSSVGGTATGLWRTGTLGPNRFGDVALPWTGYCLYFLTES